MSRNSQIETKIQSLFPGSQCRAALAQGGWVIELIAPHSAAVTHSIAMKAVEKEIRTALHPNPQVFWKIFIYSKSEDRFLIDGILHTLEKSYSPQGVPTVTLTAGDCIIRISEFDAELLLLSDYNGLVISAIEGISPSTGDAILPFSYPTKYLWLETQGGHYSLDPNVPVKLMSQQMPRLLAMKLKD